MSPRRASITPARRPGFPRSRTTSQEASVTSTLTERALGIQGRMRATARLLTASALAATLAVSGASAALAATVTVTPASGGTAILDSTGASTTYTTLGNIVFQEDIAGQIGLGNIIIKAPAGFEFRAASINVAQGGTTGASNRILLSSSLSSCFAQSSSISVTPSASTIQFRVCDTSGDNGYVQLSGLQVRPAAKTPLVSGNIYVDTTTTSSLPTVVKGVGGTNLGTLAMTGGPATTLRVLDIPSPYAAGSSSPITVIATSAAGNQSSSYRGAVKVTSTDSAATLPADYTFTAADSGVKQLSGLILRTLGSRNVTVTDKATASITGSQTGITVTHGAPSLVQVQDNTSAGTAPAGTARTVSVTLKDALGNTVTGYRGTMRFTSTDAAAVLPADYTFTAADAGTHTFTGGVTLKTVGDHSVTVTDIADSSNTGRRSGMIVTAAALDKLTVSPSSATMVAGESRSFTVTASDAYGNNLGDVTASTTFSISDGGSCTGAVCTATSAGLHTVTATYNGKTATADLMVTPAAAHTVGVTLDPSTIVADGTATSAATVTVADAHGNAIKDATPVMSTSGDVTFGGVVNNGDGTYSVTVTASHTAGDEVVTATVGPVSGHTDLHEDAALAVASISPASRGQGANGGAYGQSIIVNGAGFTAGTTASFGAGVTTKFTTFNDATKLTAHIVVAENAEVGTRDVTVTLPGGVAASLDNGFTVNAGPSVSSISPNSIAPGTVKTITVHGANFDAATKVSFPGTGVGVTKTTLVSSSLLSVEISTAKAATAGPRDLVVTNPADQGRGTAVGALTVTGAGMSLTGMDPSVLGPGALRMVTLSGSGFVNGAKVSFAGAGAAPYSVVYADATQLNVLVSVAGNATPGPRKVTVTNPDGTKVASESVFSISEGPMITEAVNPARVARGTTQTITVTGTGFQPGASLAISSWVLVSDVTVVDANTITATMTVPATTAKGMRGVTVTNPDGGKHTATALAVDSPFVTVVVG
jgi:hypothetical protein